MTFTAEEMRQLRDGIDNWCVFPTAPSLEQTRALNRLQTLRLVQVSRQDVNATDISQRIAVNYTTSEAGRKAYYEARG